MSNLKGATLREIQDLLASAKAGAARNDIAKDAIAVLQARADKAKPDSYKQRRTLAAIAAIKAGKTLDAKAAFEGAKRPVADKAAKAAPAKRKSRAKAAKAAPTPEEAEALMTQLGVPAEATQAVMAMIGAMI